MKLGQTTAVVFLSKIANAAIGFIATVYIARQLGAEVVGLYALVITIVSWTIVVGEVGIGKAIIKRISEEEESGRYLSAAIVVLTSFALIISAVILASSSVLEQYVAGFDNYVAISVVWFVILVLYARLFNRIVVKTLMGERKVHIAGLLTTLREGVKGTVQIGLVAANFGLLGILVGHAFSAFLGGIVGLYWITSRLTLPSRRHFRSLFDYAKFSWLGSLKSRTFNDLDILLLGVFVQPSQVGIYSVSWSIAKFVDLFGKSITASVFPEVSYKSTQESRDAVSDLVENSIAYTGLIAIPGLVGGVIVSERLLRIYGPEFGEGATVLSLLLLAVLLRSYQAQLFNALNGIDRPDIAFRINAAFMLLNASLNVALIRIFGVEGAATASVISIAITLVMAYRSVNSLVEFNTSVSRIFQQTVAAFVMGTIVLGTLFVNDSFGMIQSNLIITTVSIVLGSFIYIVVLSVISQPFRSAVRRNVPLSIS